MVGGSWSDSPEKEKKTEARWESVLLANAIGRAGNHRPLPTLGKVHPWEQEQK